jgi:methylenetetrahydrofolate reductase (NADPH)
MLAVADAILSTNVLRDALQHDRFFWMIEFIPSVDKILRDELRKLGGIADYARNDQLLAGFSVTDRVVSERDPEPISAASHLLDHSRKQPLVHFSGKGRDISDLNDFLRRLQENGLENVLFITGDRLRQEPADGLRARYLESVAAIRKAKITKPDLLVATAINPFKYREEDAMAQYLKLGKKVEAGADYGITQIGFDIRKYEEALLWTKGRGYRLPLVANVMPLSAARARYIRQHQLAGVTITKSVLDLLEEEERTLPDRGSVNVMRRLALQILGVHLFGYGGVQITGLHSSEKVSALRSLVDELRQQCVDWSSWNKAWETSLRFSDGTLARPAPDTDTWFLVGYRSARPPINLQLKYRVMKRLHRWIFENGLGALILRFSIKRIRRHSITDRILERIERGVKRPLFGCETCGMCRLAATQYICPETCPKGLANGACGGTTENLCEFGDRECIHSAKYRIARDMGVLDQIESWLIPAVPKAWRGTSSWPPYLRQEAPKIVVPASCRQPRDTG